MKPHHHQTPTLTITTSADADTALNGLIATLEDAKFRVVSREPGAASLKIGSFVKAWMLNDFPPVELMSRFRTWGMQVTLDLKVLDGTAPTRIQATMRRMFDHRDSVQHTLAALESAAWVLTDMGFPTELGDVGPAS